MKRAAAIAPQRAAQARAWWSFSMLPETVRNPEPAVRDELDDRAAKALARRFLQTPEPQTGFDSLQ